MTTAEPRKASYVGAPAVFVLELACQQLCEAFDGDCYLVGSALERSDWRDVDVRMIMEDFQFRLLFPDVADGDGWWEHDARWLLLTTLVSGHLSRLSGLPVDFQFQPRTWANKTFRGGRRNAIGMRPPSAESIDVPGEDR